ncbi:MAG TPA: STM4012 family radical SAM protein [Candidatus Limnocylindrales bacterium]|nr:STM4012 family radical SAM protein [Candidatus Limnocylindrales bacterium]
MLGGSPYQGYLYAYPHKTAYRPLRPRPALRDVWSAEPRDSLFLYVHIPFCEMRCGFCNLFTRSNPPAEQAASYLRQLRVQTEVVASSLGPVTFSRAAIGGGTPTFLTADELATLFSFLPPLKTVPLSVETSPATATPDRLEVLAAQGTWRVSIGVQSFLDAEAHAAGRPQRRFEVDRALQAIRDSGFPVMNLDLIYGIPGQTAGTWAESLRAALAWQPEEIYLYPLYVRPLTGLSKRHAAGPDREWDTQRLGLYRQGRDLLWDNGYQQLSMRHFRHSNAPDPSRSRNLPGNDPLGRRSRGLLPGKLRDLGPDYCCQDDGMVGLGCGARSYTRALHYSFDYAVGVGQVRGIIDDYLARPGDDFAFAEYGFALDESEQRLRWLVKSLLRVEGLDLAAYAARFGEPPGHDLAPLLERGWAVYLRGRLILTEEGLAHSDAIGPWLVSGAVREMMASAEPR